MQINLETNSWKRNIKHTHTYNQASTIRHRNLGHKFRLTHIDTNNYTPKFRHVIPKQNQSNTI